MVKRILFLLLVWAGLAIHSPAFAQSTAQVYLTPLASSDNSITVAVMADNVTDLYGVEFLLNFNPAAVSVQDTNPQQEGVQVEAGSLLPESQGFVVVNRADAATGKIAFAMTLLNPAPAVSGSGSLAQVTFNLQQSDPTQIEIEDIKLVSIALQTIPVETTGLTIGHTTAFPWWLVALVTIILGLTILSVLIIASNHKHTQKGHNRV